MRDKFNLLDIFLETMLVVSNPDVEDKKGSREVEYPAHSAPRPARETDLIRIIAIIASAYDKYLSKMDRPPVPLLED